MELLHWQCSNCGNTIDKVSVPTIHCPKCKQNEWEAMGEPSNVKYYWRCKFCGRYAGSLGNGYPAKTFCQSPKRKNENKILSCIWERLYPDKIYSGNNWRCKKCKKTAKELTIVEAFKGYNVPGLGKCNGNSPNNHIWEKIH